MSFTGPSPRHGRKPDNTTVSLPAAAAGRLCISQRLFGHINRIFSEGCKEGLALLDGGLGVSPSLKINPLPGKEGGLGDGSEAPLSYRRS